MQVIEVNSPSLVRDFIRVNVKINSTDPNYIRPLDKDILDILLPKNNRLHSRGKIKCWLIKNEKGYTGRIAAFFDPQYKNKGDAYKAGGIGFFDCINDQEAADLLFDTARNWLLSLGVQAMDGPINFGERDKWWGLLIEGFHPPLYGMNYNPPYYQELFMNYGFNIFYNQLCWHLKVDTMLADKFYVSHEKHRANPDIRAERVDKKNIEKYAEDFVTVYNKAWAGHEGNKSMSVPKAISLFKKLKPIMDPDLMWFTYYKEEPVALWLNIPDLNQIFRGFNGKFTMAHKMMFYFHKLRGRCSRFVGIIYGIVPEWQGTGIDYYMIVEASKIIQAKKKYKELELQWQGDFNPKMIAISKNLGCTLSRKLATFRYQFDKTAEFKRHPVL
jgi:hypothetical protein